MEMCEWVGEDHLFMCLSDHKFPGLDNTRRNKRDPFVTPRSSGVIFLLRLSAICPGSPENLSFLSWVVQRKVLPGAWDCPRSDCGQTSLATAPDESLGSFTCGLSPRARQWASVWVDHTQYHGTVWDYGEGPGTEGPVLLAMWPGTSPFSIRILGFLICKRRELVDSFFFFSNFFY